MDNNTALLLPFVMYLTCFIMVALATAVYVAVDCDADQYSSEQHRQPVWIVTGCAHGIGFETASAALNRGATVEMWDIRRDALAEAAVTLSRRTGGRIATRVVDVGDAAAVRAAAAAALAQHGEIDVVVSNAGVVSGCDIELLSAGDVDRTFRVNVYATFNLLREFLPAARARRRGTFVIVGSIMGTVGSARLSDYCASKWALQGLVESFRLELARDGLAGAIPVILVRPWAVSTNMFPGIFEDKRARNVLRSLLFPMLHASGVAASIVAAVVRGRSAVITLPWYAMPALMFGRLLPLRQMDAVAGWMGGFHGMSAFRPPPVAA